LRQLLDNPDRSARIAAIGGFVAFVVGYPAHTPDNSRTLEFMKPSHTLYSDDPTWRQFLLPHDPTDGEVQTAASFWKQWLTSHPELPQ
jgi:hypothetical protein